jgi:hypothetical protein
MGPLVGLLLAFVPLPGTTSVSVPLSPPNACGRCHGGFDPDDAFTGWSGSAMGHAVRDPAFLAAVTIAEQDQPGIGDLCYRCHAPEAWLQLRCIPSNGSRILPTDSGVTCSACHRMKPTPWVRNAQYVVADDTIMRGPYGSEFAPHQNERSTFLSSAELCGTCHNFTNPLRRRHDPTTKQPLPYPFAEQTTYWEWQASAFAQPGGKSCIDCHMKTSTGSVASTAGVRTDRSSHRIVGSNVFLLDAIDLLEPELELTDTLAASKAELRAQLQTAATLELRAPPGLTLARGQRQTLTVRVTNETGHKLPSGYPEQEVFLAFRSEALGVDRGALDPRTRLPVEPLAVYRTVQGQHDVGPSFHLALADTVFYDNRIPPRGMVSTATIAPVGYVYPEVSPGVLAHWDDVALELEVPCDFVGDAVDGELELLHLSLHQPYVDFLLANNEASTPRGRRLADAWDSAPAVPERITRLAFSLPVAAEACPPPDAGVVDTGVVEAPDAAAVDAAVALVDAGAVARDAAAVVDAGAGDEGGGCGCGVASGPRGLGEAAALLGLVALGRRRRSVAAARRGARRA